METRFPIQANPAQPLSLMDEASEAELDRLLRDAEFRLQGTLASRPTADTEQGPHMCGVPPSWKTGANRSVSEREVALRQVAPRQSNSSKTTKGDNTGPGWFHMGKTHLTPELKRDLQLLRMRGTLDSKRFYKKESRKLAIPEYSQVGTVIEGRTEFHQRLTRRQRHATIGDEILESERSSGKFRHKAEDIAKRKGSGKKGFYKNLVTRRRSGHQRNTE